MKKIIAALLFVPFFVASVHAVGEPLEFDFSAPFGGGRANTITLDDVYDYEVTTVSNATITISGLPPGIAYDKGTYRIVGQATMPGKYKVNVSGSNADKFTYSQVFYITVSSQSTPFIMVSDSVNELYVGEEQFWPLDLEDYFSVSTNAAGAAVKSVAVTGLPAGLTYTQYTEDEYVYREINGIPTKEGVFTVKCVVTFTDGSTDTAYSLFNVYGPDPFDYEVDFSGFEDLTVGEEYGYSPEDGEYGIYIGSYRYDGYEGYGVGVTGVTGLPSGLVLRKVRVDGDADGYTDEYYASGMVSAPGLFTITATCGYYDFDKESVATVKLSGEFIVKAVPDRYVSVAVFEPESVPGCKVSGSGVYKVGKTASLTATAATGFVFAGWCDGSGLPVVFPDVDYRTARMNCAIGTDTEIDLWAVFVAKADDVIEFIDLDGAEFNLDTAAAGGFREPFLLESESLPTLTFKGLPAGVICRRSADFADGFELYWDPLSATAATTPKPGRYHVTATAKNVSASTDTAEFTVVVANLTSEYIDVEDDYGILTPNVEMAPILFTNAVAEGWTLAVTGIPAGTKYDAAAKRLSGIPTKPGEYTLNFAAKFGTTNAVATAFIKVKDFPTIKADIEESAARAGNKVTGTGSFKQGTKASLKATAAKGWVFAGWEGLAGIEGLNALNPSQAYIVTTDDLTVVEAKFMEIREDWLYVDAPVDETNAVKFTVNEQVSTNLIETIIDTGSFPAVTVSGLPTGLSFDKKTFELKGKPTKTGVSYVTVAVKNAGGYTFTRTIRFAVLANAGDPVPGDGLKNDAGIDFSDLDGILTGDYLPEGEVESVIIEVPENPVTLAEVTKVAVSGLPAGLKSYVEIEDGVGYVEIYGTPTKPGRSVVKFAVTYADRKTAAGEYGMVVQDGGSSWLDVISTDDALCPATGSGVYASGATVKLGAKPKTGCVFGGWWEDETEIFANLVKMDGVDYRAPSASFVFRRHMFLYADAPVVIASVDAKTNDYLSVDFEIPDTWEINPEMDSSVAFTVDSLSLPKVTVSGLPKGVAADAVHGIISYDSSKASQIVPGFYTIVLKVTNTSGKTVTAKLPVFVANKEADAIGGLDPAPDAYQFAAGAKIENIIPEVDLADGWTLAAAGLPAGMKFVADKDGKNVIGYHIEGVPTKAGTNTVTFTATRTVDRVKETAVATITVQVAEMPVWAQGNFNGICYDEQTNAVGSVTLDVTAAGKITGKILTGGKTYSISAASFDAFDQEMSCYVVETAGYQIMVGMDLRRNGYAEILGEVGGTSVFCDLVQNLWKRKVMQEFKAGTKAPFNDLTCTFAANGSVTFAGKIGGVAVTGGKSQVLIDTDGRPTMVLYIANAKLPGGVYCQECALMFGIESGKIARVTIDAAE